MVNYRVGGGGGGCVYAKDEMLPNDYTYPAATASCSSSRRGSGAETIAA